MCFFDQRALAPPQSIRSRQTHWHWFAPSKRPNGRSSSLHISKHSSFAPDSILIYAGDTGEKLGYFDEERLAALGVKVDSHGKMPDVVFHYTERNFFCLSNPSPATVLLMRSDMLNS